MVLLILLMTVDDAKQKWTNLRDTYNYNRKLYEKRLSSGAPAAEEPKWAWWRSFSWFADATKRTRLDCLLEYKAVAIGTLSCVSEMRQRDTQVLQRW